LTYTQREIAINCALNIPPHLKRSATLPCEIPSEKYRIAKVINEIAHRLSAQNAARWTA